MSTMIERIRRRWPNWLTVAAEIALVALGIEIGSRSVIIRESAQSIPTAWYDGNRRLQAWTSALVGILLLALVLVLLMPWLAPYAFGITVVGGASAVLVGYPLAFLLFLVFLTWRRRSGLSTGGGTFAVLMGIALILWFVPLGNDHKVAVAVLVGIAVALMLMPRFVRGVVIVTLVVLLPLWIVALYQGRETVWNTVTSAGTNANFARSGGTPEAPTPPLREIKCPDTFHGGHFDKRTLWGTGVKDVQITLHTNCWSGPIFVETDELGYQCTGSRGSLVWYEGEAAPRPMGREPYTLNPSPSKTFQLWGQGVAICELRR